MQRTNPRGNTLEEQLEFIEQRNGWAAFLQERLSNDPQRGIYTRVEEYVNEVGAKTELGRVASSFLNQSLELQCAVETTMSPAIGYSGENLGTRIARFTEYCLEKGKEANVHNQQFIRDQVNASWGLKVGALTGALVASTHLMTSSFVDPETQAILMNPKISLIYAGIDTVLYGIMGGVLAIGIKTAYNNSIKLNTHKHNQP